MNRVIVAMLIVFVMSFPALAQDKDVATFPDEEKAGVAAIDPADVDPKILKKKLGAKDVRWDPKSGVLTLTYTFTKGQEKDWKISGRVERARAPRGIRIPSAESLTHCVPFTSASCTFRSSFDKWQDTGLLVSAHPGLDVRRREAHGVLFMMQDKETNLGRLGDGQIVSLTLGIDATRCRLAVDSRDIAIVRESENVFRFVFHGGNNGHEISEVMISGKPDVAWLAEMVAE